MLGGLFALRFQNYRHLILAFCAGAITGVAVFDLAPAAIALTRQVYSTQLVLGIVVAGFIFYLLLDQWLTNAGAAKASNAPQQTKAALIVFFLTLHSFLDGVAIGLAYQVSAAIGGVIAVAVLLHDFADGMNTANVLLRSTDNIRGSLKWLVFNAAAPFLGALSTYFYHLNGALLGILLAFMAGCFIFIGAVEFLPESRRQGQNWKSTLLTVLGLIVIFAIVHYAGE